MKAFHSGREAKEFLISEIVAEARRENVALSDVERKMLYFTESGWTLPDIMKLTMTSIANTTTVSMKEDRETNKLIKEADRRIRKSASDDYEKWWAANPFSST